MKKIKFFIYIHEKIYILDIYIYVMKYLNIDIQFNIIKKYFDLKILDN